MQSTEAWDARLADLDAAPAETALEALLFSQRAAVAAVEAAIPAIARASEAAAKRLAQGGRLVYAGAGTSGRIAAQDGAELGPTFGWPGERLLVLPAGGEKSLLVAIENAEDDGEAAAAAVARYAIGPSDVAIGVAASGTTPYTLRFLTSATERGALGIALANNPETPLLAAAAFPILLATGAEPIAGSTRLKAGTAQKIALNLFSTVLMMALHRVYRGRMVELGRGSAKLRRRAVGIVAELSATSRDHAERLLGEAGGDIKLALLLSRGAAPEDARAMLESSGGNLRAALAVLAERKQ